MCFSVAVAKLNRSVAGLATLLLASRTEKISEAVLLRSLVSYASYA